MLKRKKKKMPANQQICQVFAENFPKGFDVEVDYNYLIIFDSNGKIVGEPLLGGIDNQANLDTLQKTIDTAIAESK